MRIWHPYTQEAAEHPPIAIERGEGAYLFTRDGRRLIDGISSWWVNIHGHAHPLIADSPFTAAFDALRLPILRVRDSVQLDQLLQARKDEIAAMIVEPLVQGAGGMLVYPAAELQRYRSLCTDHDVLFIADEVFT